MASVTGLVKYFIEGSVEGFGAKIAPVTSFAYAVEEAGAGLNDIVRVPYVANETGSTSFSIGTGFTANSANGVTGKAVTLNTLLYQPIWLQDGDFLRLTPENLAALGRVAGERLASDFVSASLASVVTAGNYATTSSYSGAQYTASVAPLTLMKQADDLNWPDNGRVIVGNTQLYYNLLSNTAISAAEQYGNAAAIQEGRIPQIFGFTPYKTTMGVVGSGFAAHPSAMAFAFAPFLPNDSSAQGVVESNVAKDPKSGIQIVLRSWYDATLACNKKALCVLGGVAPVNGNALIRIG